MPINRPGRFIRRVYEEIQRGGSVRPRETRHRDSREARLRKDFETFCRKNFENFHLFSRNDVSGEQCRGAPMSGGSHRAGLVVS